MTHPVKCHRGSWRTLCALLLVGLMALTFTACSDDDEPTGMLINYYVEIEEEFLVDGTTSLTDRYHNPIELMREVIHNTYPTPNALGDDLAVIAACDDLYQLYLGMYTGRDAHLTCVVHLVKATVKDSIVRQSETLKTYTFDINPPAPNTGD